MVQLLNHGSAAKSYLILQPHGLQYARFSLFFSISQSLLKLCPLSQWCHPTISSSVIPFSSWPQSFPASGSFPTSQLFASGGQRTGASASASVLPMNIQGWLYIYITKLLQLSFCFPIAKKFKVSLEIQFIFYRGLISSPPVMQGTPVWFLGQEDFPGERIGCPLQYTWASLVAQTVKNWLQWGRPGFDPWLGTIPWRRA